LVCFVHGCFIAYDKKVVGVFVRFRAPLTAGASRLTNDVDSGILTSAIPVVWEMVMLEC
jgi:hypothetical protein